MTVRRSARTAAEAPAQRKRTASETSDGSATHAAPAAKRSAKAKGNGDAAPHSRKRGHSESSESGAEGAAAPATKGRKRTASEGSDTGAKPPAKRARAKAEVSEAPALRLERSHAPGEVLICGMNECGQLGIPGSTSYKRLKTVPNLPKALVIAAGGMHTVAACEDGKVYSWGVNDEGALGRPSDADNEDRPVAIEGLDAHSVADIVAGDSHSAVLTTRGELYAWGTFRDANGVLGFSVDVDIQRTPVLVYPVPGQPADPLVAVASGCSHLAAITASGRLVTWGSCEQGQLGRTGARVPARRLKETLLVPHPVDLSRCTKKGAAARPLGVACGNYHTLVLFADRLVGFGLNNHAQCGALTADTALFAPRVFELPADRPVAAAGGLHHSLLVTESGRVFSCGNGNYGRLGHGDTNDRNVFTPVERLGDAKVVSVACGVCTSYAVTADGAAHSWGMGEGGMLGLGDEDDRETPERISGRELERPNTRVLAVSAGGQHTIVVVDRPPAPEGMASAPQTPVAPKA